MKTGVLVMMDALGFKGIWKRQKPSNVIGNMVKLKRTVDAKLDEEFITNRPASKKGEKWSIFKTVESVFISDTIVIGFAFKDIEKMLIKSFSLSKPLPSRLSPKINLKAEVAYWRKYSVCGALSQVSRIISSSASSQVPLAYRGCISFGEFDLRDNFIIGPAVDEAGSMMDVAQGAFVWLTPSALAVYKANHTDSVIPFKHLDDGYSRMYTSWKVPLKGGDTFDTIVAAPYFNSINVKHRNNVTDAILGTFTGPLDVMVKKQYTEQFLNHATSLWKKGRIRFI